MLGPAVHLKALVPNFLVVLGWILRCRFVEVAGPVSVHVRKK